MGDLLFGIDVGTYSSKGVLVDSGGALLKSHVVPHTVDFPQPGWAEHDADAVWWADVVELCNTLLDGSANTSDDVAAVCLSALGPCRMALDAQARPLRPGRHR